MEKGLSYKKSGVNIDVANATKRGLKDLLKTKDPRVLNGIGAFGSLYDIKFPEYKNPVLVLKTEEPGSKQLLAFQHDRFESIGFDMINHLINDCIVMGARPLAVQDAIICGKLERDKVTRMITAIGEACRLQGCVLTGGEISEQPAVIPAGTYILTSSIVGIVDKKDIIDGSGIRAGDTVVGLASSGLHTNGYSLARRLLKAKPSLTRKKIAGVPFVDLLLEPHRCYYTAIRDLFPKKIIKGMAHITGGGIRENLDRILPGSVDAVINLGAYRVLPVFTAIRGQGRVADDEMLRTFNMGVGLTIVCKPENADAVIRHVKTCGVDAYPIGRTVKGSGRVTTENSLRW